jgi:hypothetical protein
VANSHAPTPAAAAAKSEIATAVSEKGTDHGPATLATVSGGPATN